MCMIGVLLLQAVFFSSSTTSFSLNNSEPDRSSVAFGLGSPIGIVTLSGKADWLAKWHVLLLNLAATYMGSALVATWLAKLTRLQRPARAFGLVAGAAIAATFLVSIVISKVYWGHFISRPALIGEVSEIAKIKAVISFKTELDAFGKHTTVPDNTYSLSDRLASGKKYGDDSLEERILVELERRNLLPAAFATTLAGFPEVYRLIQGSGVLATSSRGYDSAARLEGIAVDATDKAGNRIVILGLTGGQLSNDHYPYYELVFRGQKAAAELSFARGQRFFYDAAGMEGFEWYVIMLYLSIPGIAAGFIIFTISRLIWKKQPDAV